MTSQQIEYVLTLAEEKSFSKAATRLYVTQPSLSQFIKNLENELSTTLFDRSTSPIRLTPAGQVFIEAARKIKSIEEELSQQLADLTNLKSGDLRIGTSPFRSACLLPKSIAEFHKTYPGVSIHILEEKSSVLEKSLMEGSIDLLLGTGPFDENLYYAEELASEQLYLAVPSDYPINNELIPYQITDSDIKTDNVKLHKTPGIDLSRLSKETFIIQKQGQKLNGVISKICKDSSFAPETTLNSERIESSFAWTLAGIGISFVPDFLIRFGNHDRHPVYYKINHPLASRNIYIAYRKNRYLTSISVEYMNVLKKLIGYGTWGHPDATTIL